MDGANWSAMSASQRRKYIGILMIAVGRYMLPFAGLLNAYTMPGIVVLITIYGGLFLGLVGLGLYIWGIVGGDRPTGQKIISILLSVGIFMGGWLGAACIAASLLLSFLAKRKSRRQDDLDANNW